MRSFWGFTFPVPQGLDPDNRALLSQLEGIPDPHELEKAGQPLEYRKHLYAGELADIRGLVELNKGIFAEADTAHTLNPGLHRVTTELARLTTELASLKRSQKQAGTAFFQ